MPASHERQQQASQREAGFAEGLSPELRPVIKPRTVGAEAIRAANHSYYNPEIHPELAHPDNPNIKVGDQN